MSRYVDLDGLTWDGKTITSKIQEVKTKTGYMQGITIGWLWGDNVPHIDLADHDKQIIQKFADWLDKMDYLNEVDVDYDWDENPYETVIGLTAKDVIEQYLEQMEGGAE